jgi:hypothetical protein
MHRMALVGREQSSKSRLASQEIAMLWKEHSIEGMSQHIGIENSVQFFGRGESMRLDTITIELGGSRHRKAPSMH